jgi:hypothetical protein
LLHIELEKIVEKLLSTGTAKTEGAWMNEPLPTDQLTVLAGNGVRVAKGCQILSAVPPL